MAVCGSERSIGGLSISATTAQTCSGDRMACQAT